MTSQGLGWEISVSEVWHQGAGGLCYLRTVWFPDYWDRSSILLGSFQFRMGSGICILAVVIIIFGGTT